MAHPSVHKLRCCCARCVASQGCGDCSTNATTTLTPGTWTAANAGVAFGRYVLTFEGVTMPESIDNGRDLRLLASGDGGNSFGVTDSAMWHQAEAARKVYVTGGAVPAEVSVDAWRGWGAGRYSQTGGGLCRRYPFWMQRIVRRALVPEPAEGESFPADVLAYVQTGVSTHPLVVSRLGSAHDADAGAEMPHAYPPATTAGEPAPFMTTITSRVHISGGPATGGFGGSQPSQVAVIAWTDVTNYYTPAQRYPEEDPEDLSSTQPEGEGHVVTNRFYWFRGSVEMPTTSPAWSFPCSYPSYTVPNQLTLGDFARDSTEAPSIGEVASGFDPGGSRICGIASGGSVTITPARLLAPSEDVPRDAPEAYRLRMRLGQPRFNAATSNECPESLCKPGLPDAWTLEGVDVTLRRYTLNVDSIHPRPRTVWWGESDDHYARLVFGTDAYDESGRIVVQRKAAWPNGEPPSNFALIAPNSLSGGERARPPEGDPDVGRLPYTIGADHWSANPEGDCVEDLYGTGIGTRTAANWAFTAPTLEPADEPVPSAPGPAADSYLVAYKVAGPSGGAKARLCNVGDAVDPSYTHTLTITRSVYEPGPCDPPTARERFIWLGTADGAARGAQLSIWSNETDVGLYPPMWRLFITHGCPINEWAATFEIEVTRGGPLVAPPPVGPDFVNGRWPDRRCVSEPVACGGGACPDETLAVAMPCYSSDGGEEEPGPLIIFMARGADCTYSGSEGSRGAAIVEDGDYYKLTFTDAAIFANAVYRRLIADGVAGVYDLVSSSEDWPCPAPATVEVE